jgi:hypothetical protein
MSADSKTMYGVLCCRSKNLGDDVQRLAAQQFLPRVDVEVDRDAMSAIQALSGTIRLIMNGWFMLHRNPEWLRSAENALARGRLRKPLLRAVRGMRAALGYDWPPPQNVDPLFVSFHADPGFRSSGAIEYLKRHAPIGCRDLDTLDWLQSQGVPAWFSGCLTLTLPRSNVARTNEVCLVEAVRKEHSRWSEEFLRRLPDSLRTHAVTLTHRIEDMDWSRRAETARQRLERYAAARLVITSRIHCLLPCLAIGTPVIFINNQKGVQRYGGLLDLVEHHDLESVVNGDARVNWIEPACRRQQIDDLAGVLRDRCSRFVAGA